MDDRFYIQDFDETSGLQNDKRPFLIPDKAYARINDAYVFRGRTRKRFGTRWMGDDPLGTRFRINIATTDGSGNTPGGTFVPRDTANVPIATPAIGQAFSVGTAFFTVVALGTPANLLRNDGVVGTATFNTTTGEVVINGAPALATVYYYPSLPVMGLLTFEDAATNFEPVIGFDTRFAYQYLNGWERIATELTTGAASWRGNNSQFFWATSWTGADPSQTIFFVTNFNPNEFVPVTHPVYMRYLFNNQWQNFRPRISIFAAGPPVIIDSYLDSAEILIAFKNRLCAFNTYESESTDGVVFTQKNYRARGRWSWLGSPIDTTAFLQSVPGKGNFVDAATTESIITVEFIKDRVIVFCERSTFEWVYQANQAYPFSFQKINTELGAESTFSIVPFDKVCIGVGNVGIVACNGTSVERIDQKIPIEVFKIHNADQGVERVYGIRDYFTELVYWTYPSETANNSFPYPNRVLVYNYERGTWSFNFDSFTCFGYFQPSNGITWDSTTITWDMPVSWDSGSIQSRFRQVIAGNQEGYVLIVDSDEMTNAQALQITNISTSGTAANIVTITAINHNLRQFDYVYIDGIVDNVGDLEDLNGKIFAVASNPLNEDTPNSFSFIYNAIDGSSLPILTGTYAGGGRLSRVSNPNILTKQYNFYAQQGLNAQINKIDFLVDRTDTGQIEVNYYTSSSIIPLVQAGNDSGSADGTSILETTPYALYPYESSQERLWHPLYFNAEGEVIQLEFKLNDQQMRNPDIREADFQLHAMCIYANPTSRFQ